ncbi:hypothetical protein [Acidovorax sp. SUPP3334]|uniref:hypothetical protein n=1 Tax=Acidovorax sp. SUPP3334 TaxID=2920881 RepID=UPI0023DE4856|nr:hypothetical protein [Acidovorax sp. SUPP3334]GKT22450.1 hypothetical protein AVHM3334_08480 [Acidovorax sp. SUPP3334]
MGVGHTDTAEQASAATPSSAYSRVKAHLHLLAQHSPMPVAQQSIRGRARLALL